MRVENTIDEEPTIRGTALVRNGGRKRSAPRHGPRLGSCSPVVATENLADLRPILGTAAIPARRCVGERRYCNEGSDNEESNKSGGDYSHPNLLELPRTRDATLSERCRVGLT